MKHRKIVVFSALTIGSATGFAVHGCTDPVMADTGTGGAAGGSSAAQCAAPAPRLLTTYDDLHASLAAGARVRVVLDYSKCTLDGGAAPNALGAMNMDTFEWFGPNVVGNAKPYIAASENHLISFPPGYVYDYVKVRIFDDGKVTVGVQYLDPTTYAVKVDETIECTISDGTNEGGASFFKTTP